jgi:hypothetical protein
MPCQIEQSERLALVQMVENAGLVRAQEPLRPGITNMPRVAGKVDAGVELHHLSSGITRHAQGKQAMSHTLICQIKLLPQAAPQKADRRYSAEPVALGTAG